MPTTKEGVSGYLGCNYLAAGAVGRPLSERKMQHRDKRVAVTASWIMASIRWGGVPANLSHASAIV
jgi:hypothetical protein